MQGQGQETFTWKKVTALIFFIWASAFGIASPTAIEYAVYDVDILEGNRHEHWSHAEVTSREN